MALLSMEFRSTARSTPTVFHQLRFVLLRRAVERYGGSWMAVTSWVVSANDPATDFPIQNLPYGVFRYGQQARIGVAIGDRVLDLHGCAIQGLLAPLREEIVCACRADVLNPLMSLGADSWKALWRRLTEILDGNRADRGMQSALASLLLPMRDVEMQLPARIGDYTAFYASIHHATRVGKLFRPDNPLLPNYKYIPIGYHGRASSIVVSGHAVRRPSGQIKPLHGDPAFGPSNSLDYELEMGIFVGPGNLLGQTIPIDEAEQHIFGLCIV